MIFSNGSALRVVSSAGSSAGTGAVWAWRPRGAVLLVVALVGVVAGCKKAPTERATVIASVAPLGDLTKRIAGADADVVVAYPPGVSPRSQAPAVGDAAFAAARLVVVVGLGLDGDLEGTAKSRKDSVRVLRVGDRVPTVSKAGTDGVPDPFVWLDPARMRFAVKAIGEELARVDSSHASGFRERALAVDSELAALDAELEGAVNGIGSTIVARDDGSLAYFADRYGLTFGDAAAAATGGVAVSVAPFGTTTSSTYESVLRDVVASVRAATSAKGMLNGR